MKKAAMAGALGFGLLIALLLSMFLIIASDEDSGGSGSGLYIGVNLSPEVLAHQPMVEKYARQNGISDYVYVLLAIIQVESEGKLEDVMQSSESAGLPVNTLGTEDSIKQGCKYFAELSQRRTSSAVIWTPSFNRTITAATFWISLHETASGTPLNWHRSFPDSTPAM